MRADERQVLVRPADKFLTWAVGRDLQQSLISSGNKFDLAEIMRDSESELSNELLENMSREQRVAGNGLFRYAMAFVLLHELAHLDYGHAPCSGAWSFHQEKDADRFAADWLLDSTQQKLPMHRRINILNGMSIALIWITVRNIYLGPTDSDTHPEGYDRLFQVLDHAINPGDEIESSMAWYFVMIILFVHMDNADYELDSSKMQDGPKDAVNYMIDVLSKK
jgi:hypothetical protein